MKLRGVKFKPVLGAAGVQGFFGEQYKHQQSLGPLKANFKGSTFVAKTTTLNARKGNAPLEEDGITLTEFSPRCILPNLYPENILLSLKMFIQGYMLNSVGLSGPGAGALFEDGRWQDRTEPFFISFMSVAKTPEERIGETEEFVRMFAKYLPGFKAPVGWQINGSCPNVGLDLSRLIKEIKLQLKIGSILNIAQMPKLNILASQQAVKEISNDPNCDAVCLSNTLPFGKLPEKINWEALFGSMHSPLEEFGGGGLSGKPLFPLLVEWLRLAKEYDIQKPINAGGGVFYKEDIDTLIANGLHLRKDSVFIGSVATLRPWRVQSIIRRTNRLFEKGVA